MPSSSERSLLIDPYCQKLEDASQIF
jgi:hypothetical protein